MRNVGSVVVEDPTGKIVGAGILRPVVEAIMILDLDRSLREKSSALTLMIQEAVYHTEQFGETQVHAFVESPEFVQQLKKHYGFADPKGRALVLEL